MKMCGAGEAHLRRLIADLEAALPEFWFEPRCPPSAQRIAEVSLHFHGTRAGRNLVLYVRSPVTRTGRPRGGHGSWEFNDIHGGRRPHRCATLREAVAAIAQRVRGDRRLVRVGAGRR